MERLASLPTFTVNFPLLNHTKSYAVLSFLVTFSYDEEGYKAAVYSFIESTTGHKALEEPTTSAANNGDDTDDFEKVNDGDWAMLFLLNLQFSAIRHLAGFCL